MLRASISVLNCDLSKICSRPQEPNEPVSWRCTEHSSICRLWCFCWLLDGKVMTPCTHWKICSLSKQLLFINAMYNIYVEKKKSPSENLSCLIRHADFFAQQNIMKNHFGYKSFNQKINSSWNSVFLSTSSTNQKSEIADGNVLVKKKSRKKQKKYNIKFGKDIRL